MFSWVILPFPMSLTVIPQSIYLATGLILRPTTALHMHLNRDSMGSGLRGSSSLPMQSQVGLMCCHSHRVTALFT